MKIALVNRQRALKIQTLKVKAAAAKILSVLGCTSSELVISIVGDRTIRALNREYLNKDRPTNVISFSMQEGEFSSLSTGLLGDVVISAATAAREAEEAGISFHERLIFLLLHGILHLTGYDHERSGEAEAVRMEAREHEIFECLGSAGLL